jgi:hypothetical protein
MKGLDKPEEIEIGQKIQVDRGLGVVDYGTLKSVDGISSGGFFGTYTDSRDKTKTFDQTVHTITVRNGTPGVMYDKDCFYGACLNGGNVVLLRENGTEELAYSNDAVDILIAQAVQAYKDQLIRDVEELKRKPINSITFFAEQPEFIVEYNQAILDVISIIRESKEEK